MSWRLGALALPLMVFSGAVAFTRDTDARTPAVNPEVARRVRVTMGTPGFSRVDKSEAPWRQIDVVISSRYRNEVRRVETKQMPAAMVNVEAARNRPDADFISEPVDEPLPALDRRPSVAGSACATGPYPAICDGGPLGHHYAQVVLPRPMHPAIYAVAVIPANPRHERTV